MESTCKVIPFQGNRVPAAQPLAPSTTQSTPTNDLEDKKSRIAAILHEALPAATVELAAAFRGLPDRRRAALIGIASAWSGDHAARALALDQLYAALTPAERLHLDCGSPAKLAAAERGESV